MDQTIVEQILDVGGRIIGAVVLHHRHLIADLHAITLGHLVPEAPILAEYVSKADGDGIRAAGEQPAVIRLLGKRGRRDVDDVTGLTLERHLCEHGVVATGVRYICEDQVLHNEYMEANEHRS